MADTKISALTVATTPLAGTEVLPIVQSGVTKQVSVANLTAGRAVSADSLTLTGNLIQGTAAKGINFTANTPAAGMTSQLLNWYEEGAYGTSAANGILTPSTSGSITCGSDYTVSYTRIGRQVFCQGILTVTAVSSPVGYIKIALPFTPSSSRSTYGAGNCIVDNVDLPTGAVSVGIVWGSDAVCWPRISVDNGSYANVNASLLTNGSQIQFSVCYVVA